ncbi:MAG: hypothetical protein AB7T63_12025 [Planctomycetota bacterium]
MPTHAIPRVLAAVLLGATLVSATAVADDKPTSGVIQRPPPAPAPEGPSRVYDTAGLGFTQEMLAELPTHPNGRIFLIGREAEGSQRLLVQGPDAFHRAVEAWIEQRRGLLEGVDTAILKGLVWHLEQRIEASRSRHAQLVDQREALDGHLRQLAQDGGDDARLRRDQGTLLDARSRVEEAIARSHAEQRELEQKLDVLRGPGSEERRKAIEALNDTLVTHVRTGPMVRRLPGPVLFRVQGDTGTFVSVDQAAADAVAELKRRAAAIERQRADLDVRVARIADLAGRLEADEHDKRASLDKEIDRITRTQDELKVMAESLAVRKTQLESALAEKRYDELRQHIAKLDAEAREREASRSARRPQANTSQRNPEERAGLLDEVRALRAEVREVKALVLKLLEQDAAEADARSAR